MAEEEGVLRAFKVEFLEWLNSKGHGMGVVLLAEGVESL